VPAFFIGFAGWMMRHPKPRGTALAGKKEQILALAEPVAAELGLEILGVEFGGSDAKRVIRLFLDRISPPSPADGGAPPAGVTLGDCEAVSRRLGDIFDAHEAIAGRYLLEVSSPGVNRPLLKPEHFRRVVGDKVRVRFRQLDGSPRTVVGELTAFEDEGQILTIRADSGENHRVALSEVERANLEYEFPTAERPGKRRR
jgi:ribosome maturation factor RimP